MERALGNLESTDLETTVRTMQRLAHALIFDRQGAEDVAQEAALRALESPPQDSGAMKGWARHVVRNLAANRGRSIARRLAREESVARREAVESHSESVGRLEMARTVVDEVLALREPYRTTVHLRYFEGLLPREIAKREGIPTNTVQVRLHRALGELRSRLDARAGGDRSQWCAALVPLAFPRQGWLAALAGAGAWVKGHIVAHPLVSLAALSVGSLALWPLLDSAPPPDPVTVARPASTFAGHSTLERPVDLETARLPESAPTPENASGPDSVSVAEEPSSGSLVAYVEWHDGAPAPGITLDLFTVLDPAPRQDLYRAVTDARGIARWDDLPAGATTITSDRGTAWDANVVAGEEKEIELRLREGIDIEGRVVDSERNPIGGAEIWHVVGGRSSRLGYSASDGSYLIEDVTRSTLRAYAPGHQPSNGVPVEVIPANGDGVRYQELVLGDPGGSVSGRVLGPDGAPIEGAWVKVSPLAPEDERLTGTFYRQVSVETAADGRFEFPGDVAPGPGVVVVRAHGLPLWSQELDVPASHPTWIDAQLEEAARIEGRVLNEAGEPMACADVSASTWDVGWVPTPFPVSRTTSDDDGWFELDWLAGGPQTITARAAAATTDGMVELDVDLVAGTAHRIDLVLERGRSIVGRAVDINGDPVEKLMVSVRSSRFGFANSRTDADGRFELTNLSNTAYQLVVLDFSSGSTQTLLEQAGVRPSKRELELVVDSVVAPEGTVRGRLKGQDGEPISGLQYALRREGQLEAEFRVMYSPDGAFEFKNVPGGRWRLEVVRINRAVYLSEWFDVGADSVDLGEISTLPTGSVEIVVEGFGTGPMLSLAMPQVALPDAVIGQRMVLEDGVFRVSDVAPGHQYVRFGVPGMGIVPGSKPLYLPETPIVVRSGETTRLVVEAEPAGLAEIFVDHGDEPAWSLAQILATDEDGRRVLARGIPNQPQPGRMTAKLVLPYGVHEIEVWTDSGERGFAVVEVEKRSNSEVGVVLE